LSYIKDPDDVLDYEINWSSWLGAQTISASVWTLPAGITNDADSFTDTTTLIRLSGGTAGTDYELLNQITTSAGQEVQRVITIQVRSVEVVATALIVTPGGTTSNSYGTLAEAQTYFSRKLYTDSWDAATNQQRELALLMAAERLEQLDYVGIVVDEDQAMKWPRQLNEAGDLIRTYAITTIPTPVKHAQFEMAHWILQTEGGSSVIAGAGDIESLKIGNSVEVKYSGDTAPATTATTTVDPTAVDWAGVPITVARMLAGLRLIPVLA
jgi:hypothetical protein